MAVMVARLAAYARRPAGRLPAGAAVLDAVGMGALAALIVAGFCAG